TGAVFQGPMTGFLDVEGGATVQPGPLRLTLNGGAVQVPGNLTITGSSYWDAGGNFDVSGSITIGSGGSLRVRAPDVSTVKTLATNMTIQPGASMSIEGQIYGPPQPSLADGTLQLASGVTLHNQGGFGMNNS